MLGTAIGFVAIAGWWHLMLWRRFHNPIFPYANNIFRSPDYPPVGQRDWRFLPRSAWDIVRYPYYWLMGGSPTKFLPSPASETDPKDARFALTASTGTGDIVNQFGPPLMLEAARRSRTEVKAILEQTLKRLQSHSFIPYEMENSGQDVST